jgi:hypothetical protein
MRGEPLAIPGHTWPHLGAEGMATGKTDRNCISSPGHTWPYLIAIRGYTPQYLQLGVGMARYGHLQRAARTNRFLAIPLP